MPKQEPEPELDTVPRGTRILEEEDDDEQRPPPSAGYQQQPPHSAGSTYPLEYGTQRPIKVGGQPTLPPPRGVPGGPMWVSQDRASQEHSNSMPALPRPHSYPTPIVDHRQQQRSDLRARGHLLPPKQMEVPDIGGHRPRSQASTSTSNRGMAGSRRSPRSPRSQSPPRDRNDIGLCVTPIMSYSGGPFYNTATVLTR